MMPYILQKGRAIGRLILFAVPIPLVAFATDMPYVASFSLLVFMLASLALPCTVYRWQVKGKGTSVYAPVGPTLYGSIIALIAAVGILNGIMLSPLWKTYAFRVAFFALWMIGTVAVQAVVSWGIAAWRRHVRAYWFSEFLDPILYALPLPCAVMGMFMFPGTGADGVTSSLIIGMLGIISFGFIVIAILGMATFAFYFYPKPALYPRTIDKVIGLVRIVVMTVVFLGIHYVFFNGEELPYRYFLYYCSPLTQNNPIVFVSVFVLESFIIAVSISISNLISIGLEKVRPN